MTMIKCTECNNSVSTKAKTCPSCGAPVTKKKTTRTTWAAAIAIAFIIIIVTTESDKTEKQLIVKPVINNQPGKPEQKQVATTTATIKEHETQKPALGWEALTDPAYEKKQPGKPQEIVLSDIEKKKLKAFKKILDNLKETGVITSVDDEETVARIYLNPTNWKNALYKDKVNLAFGMFQYFNLLHMSKNKPPVESLYLRDAYTNDSLGMYSLSIGASIE